MNKTLSIAVIALLLCSTSVLALTHNNDGVPTPNPKYAPPSWTTTGSHRCTFRTNTYPDGSVHNIYGVLGLKSDGKSVCFIPTFGSHPKKK